MCYVEGFHIKFSADTNGLKFIAVKTSAILYISREFPQFYHFLLKLPLPTAALQTSRTETFPPALFDAASPWRPANHGFSSGRAITFPF